ncbi:MAG: NapH/MauN family ferredoxin-type protein [bacterium]|nr:NapH/MauN family ferredoxin-type protein [bacterium]
MRTLIESLAVLFGRTPRQPAPESISDAARAIHEQRMERRTHEETERIKGLHSAQARKLKRWRLRRWATLILVNLLFIVSYKLDIQMLEGALTASRFVGFHMADLNAALQVMLAYKQVLINLLIGIVTILLIWWTLGGRTFCSWICPYHLVSEWAEIIHMYLRKRNIVREHTFSRATRTWLWLIFAALAFVTGYTVFETISPTGILSRALTYGPGLALLWVGFLLLIEIFYSRRAWCRYVCPIGLTYGLVGSTSPFRVQHDLKKCHHDGICRAVCLVPHTLEATKRGRSSKVKTYLGADCTRCGKCIDVCPTGALQYKFKGLGKSK